MMDILLFILGMSMAVGIAVAIVAVIAFVKVNKTNKDVNDLQRELSIELENQNRARNDVVQEVFRTMDSRLDKLESKLLSRKA